MVFKISSFYFPIKNMARFIEIGFYFLSKYFIKKEFLNFWIKVFYLKPFFYFLFKECEQNSQIPKFLKSRN
jgi:hypothetical protein